MGRLMTIRAQKERAAEANGVMVLDRHRWTITRVAHRRFSLDEEYEVRDNEAIDGKHIHRVGVRSGQTFCWFHEPCVAADVVVAYLHEEALR